MTHTPTPLMRRLVLALGAGALTSLAATGWAQDAAVAVADDEQPASMQAEADAAAAPNAGGREAQALDTTAGTTDQSVNVPTGWWAYANVTVLDKSGSAGKPITYCAYLGEKPVFDFSGVKAEGMRINAFLVTGSWLHFKGLEVTGVRVSGLMVNEAWQ